MPLTNCGTCGQEFDARTDKLKIALAANRRPYCSVMCRGRGIQRSIGNDTQAKMRALGLSAELARCLGHVFNSARKTSRLRRREFSLTREDIVRLVERSNGRCEITGIPFEITEQVGRHDLRPWIPSIDRIDCAQGYTVENVRLVCSAVNLAMNKWGLENLKRIARCLV